MDTVIERLVEMFKLIVAISRFMGDDALSVFKTNSSLSTNEVKLIRDVIVDTSAVNGFKVSDLKTVISRVRFNYLKVTFIRGIYFPLPQMMLYANERQMDPTNPITVYTGLYSKASMMCSRGYKAKHLDLFLLFCWSIQRRLLLPYREGSTSKRFVYLPFGTIWLPIPDGGVGSMPKFPYIATKAYLLYLVYGSDVRSITYLMKVNYFISSINSKQIMKDVYHALIESSSHSKNVIEISAGPIMRPDSTYVHTHADGTPYHPNASSPFKAGIAPNKA